jgi:hypothetical protein
MKSTIGKLPDTKHDSTLVTSLNERSEIEFVMLTLQVLLLHPIGQPAVTAPSLA